MLCYCECSTLPARSRTPRSHRAPAAAAPSSSCPESIIVCHHEKDFYELTQKGFHIPVAGGAPARPSRKQSRSHSNLLLSRSISPSAPSSGSVGETIRKLQN